MKMTKRNEFLFRTVAAGALCSGLAFGAMAQDATDSADDAIITTPVADESDSDALTQETIRVTGSRLANEYTSIAPLDIISADSGALKGIADVGTLLQTATVAAGSPQVTAATSSAFVQNGGIGTETISLRGLGANRTLVLLNGRRAGP
ncbi:MAG: TonB-dependent receptor plug domain-containing protein, partial [Hyphomonas sp.]|nr:TonB-dependent receptor plug domain-containing protein [Hyphomonas sp.]